MSKTAGSMWSKDETAAVYGSCLYSYVIRFIQDHKLSVPTDRGMSRASLLKGFGFFKMNPISFF